MKTHYDCPCPEKSPLNYAISIISDKWKMQIMRAFSAFHIFKNQVINYATALAFI